MHETCDNENANAHNIQSSNVEPSNNILKSNGQTRKLATRRIHGITFILDDVFYDHTRMLGNFAENRAIQQLLLEGVYHDEEVAYEALHQFRQAYGYRKRFPRFIELLVAQQHIENNAGQRVLDAYYQSRISEARSLRPFPQARETLETLRRMGYDCGLLLVGKQDVVLERLKALGIEDLFNTVVFVESNPTKAQLAVAMKEISRNLMLPPSSILFIGRKVFDEIKAAKKAGMVTVQMRYGKYASVLPIAKLEQPDFQITTIDQVPAIVHLADIDKQSHKPKIVAIGGGTGLAILLKELRNYPADLTAVVTVFDSGRHSGSLRKNLGILPPGDVRNCLVALSEEGELINKLMNYRFKENTMEGISLGNLLLAALTDLQNGFDKAIQSLSDVLNIRGNVFPATLHSTELAAELEDGTIVISEVNVRSPTICDVDGSNERKKPRIKRVYLENQNVEAFPPAIKAIEQADIIVLAPGGFYTSILSPILVPGIRKAIANRSGALVYISNVATQCGQTDGMTLRDSIDILSSYLETGAPMDWTNADNNLEQEMNYLKNDTLRQSPIDYVIANNALPSKEIMDGFCNRGEELLLPKLEEIKQSLWSMPTIIQGQTYEDHLSHPDWQKAAMLRHHGKAVVEMLYRIIDMEMEHRNSIGSTFTFTTNSPSVRTTIWDIEWIKKKVLSCTPNLNRPSWLNVMTVISVSVISIASIHAITKRHV